jgi:hypothetical protein
VVFGRKCWAERRRKRGGRRKRVGRVRFLDNMEPERVATPTYKTPGVSGSSGAMMDFIRSENVY